MPMPCAVPCPAERVAFAGPPGSTGPMANAQDELVELLARTSLRDRAAFATLYERTSAKLFGIALRICASRAEAEEVVQVAYLKVWRSADRFAASRASPIAWMAAIARNAAIDRRRAESARGGEHKPLGEPGASGGAFGGGFEPVDDAPSPEDAAVLASEARALDRCLGELDERHAEAVRRAYLDGLAYREIASALGVPENTIKTWVRRSLGRLRLCMDRVADRAANGGARTGTGTEADGKGGR